MPGLRVTPIVELVEITEAHKQAVRSSKARLRSLLKVSIPRNWPQFAEAFAASDANSPLFSDWPSYFFLSPTDRYLVGNGGFAGPPDALGQVEIGYEIAPRFQNRGFATAAARRLLEVAFSRAEVSAVVAQTLAEQNASSSVLRKVGMRYVAERNDLEAGPVWLWRIARAGSD